MVKNKNLKIIYNVVGFAVVIFLAIRELCGAALLRIPFGDNNILLLAVSMVIFAAACLVPVVTMENTLGLHPKLFKKVNAKNALSAVMYGYLLMLGASFTNGIVLALLKRVGLQFAPNTLDIPQGFAGVLYFVYVCILPAVLEEIFTRGYILNAFRGFGQSFAIIVSSLCFALLHSSMDNFIFYFCCGIVLAQIYITFDSLLPAIMLHLMNNSLSFFISMFRSRANAQSALSLIIFIYAAVIIFGCAGKKILDTEHIRFSDCFTKDTDILKKIFFCRKAYMGLAALGLMVFFALLGSYNSLI